MKLLIYLILLSTTLSCSKTNLNKICDVDDPITELGWLADIIADANANSENIKVSKAIVKNKDTNKKEKMLIILRGQMSCYYNCSGDSLGISGGINPNANTNKYEVIKSEELYRNY